MLILLLLAWRQLLLVMFLLTISRIFQSLLLLHLMFPIELIDVVVIALVFLAAVRPSPLLGERAIVLLKGPCLLLAAGLWLLLMPQLLVLLLLLLAWVLRRRGSGVWRRALVLPEGPRVHRAVAALLTSGVWFERGQGRACRARRLLLLLQLLVVSQYVVNDGRAGGNPRRVVVGRRVFGRRHPG